MSSGGKADSGQKSYNYFGSIAGVVRAGAVDVLHAMLADGKAFWEGPISQAGHDNPYLLSITDPKWLHGGYVNFYWGLDSQTVADDLLDGHPPYRGFAYPVYRKFLFGKERTAAPNMELIATAFARPPSSVISSTALHNDSCNPFAILAELLTSIHGAALDASMLNSERWQAAHDFFAATTALRDASYCAPLLDSQEELRSVVTSILQLCDGWLRFDPDGKIEAGFFDIDPGDLSDYTTITANDLVEPPRLKTETWDKVPTGVVYSFTERDRNWKQTSDKVDSLLALRAAVQPRRERLDLSHVLSRQQAQTIAAEWVKRYCRPQMSGTIVVRREKATWLDGSPLRPGDRFLLDVGPEPGGAASLQLCRVLERRFGAKGPVTLKIKAEVNQPAIPYTPAYTPADVEEVAVSNIEHARILPLPPAISQAPAIGVLASRPSDLVVGARVLFDVEGGSGTFTTIGTQVGFAVRCALADDFAADDEGAVRIEILDARDQHLALESPGASGAQNDELLLILLKKDGDFIAEDANGFPLMEIFSIQDYEATGPDAYNFACLRARLGTNPLDWDADDEDMESWIIPRESLRPWTHTNFSGYVANHAELVFRLRAFNRFAEYDDTLDDFAFRFPQSYAPPSIVWTTPANNPETLETDELTPAATVSDPNRNLVGLELFSVREDTGIGATHLRVSFPRRDTISLSEAFALAGVTDPELTFPDREEEQTFYDLILRAVDDSGAMTESKVIIIRPASGGEGEPPPSGLSVPTVTPPGGVIYPGGYEILVTVSGDADRFDYKFDSSHSNTPPVSYSTVMDVSASLSTGGVGQNFRFWCRASNASDHSAWIWYDFTRHH